MKRNGIGFGIFLIIVGVIVFLVQVDILDGEAIWGFLNHLPVVFSSMLIVIGINMIFRKYSFVKIITWAVFFIAIILYGYYAEKNVDNLSYNTDTTFIVERFSETVNGELKLDASALNMKLGSNETNLIEGTSSDIGLNHKVDYKDDKKTAVVRLDTKGDNFVARFFRSLFSKEEFSFERKCSLNISNDVIWDMDMNINATDSEMDLSGLKIKDIDIEGNAGSFKLTLGQEYARTKVNIKANAAEVDVFVPVDSGLKVNVEGNASSTDFKGLSMKKQGKYYISENYDEMDNKIEMDIEVNAGGVEINAIE